MTPIRCCTFAVLALLPAASADDSAALLSPTQGRPAFVSPGGMLELVALAPGVDPASHPSVTLVSRGFPPHRHELEPSENAAAKLLAGEPQYLQVPKDIPRQTYDLELRVGDVTLHARHAVAVGDVSDQVRIVHLSDMNIGDFGAADFDTRLIDEVNLVAPTLIIATGDYLDAGASDAGAGWKRLSTFFAKFDAPVLMACGDHDDIDLYGRTAAPGPIGTIQVGPYRGIVMLDHSRYSITGDPQQIAWVERLLKEPRSTFMVSHDESPGLVRHWLQEGTLDRRLSGNGLLAWFSGGHRDWSASEYAQRSTAAAETVFIRTHQSSTATLEGASGTSHYRIVDLIGQRVVMPHEGASTSPAATPSIAVGRLNAFFHAPNDGSARQVAFTVTNNLPYRLKHLRMRVLIRREGDQPPWCQAAELSQIVSYGHLWECSVSFDLPDRSARRIVVGTGVQPPTDSIRVDFDVPEAVKFQTHVTNEGVEYQSSVVEPLIFLSHAGEEPIEIMPRIRLDGNTIAYRPIDRDGPLAMAYRLTPQRDEIVALRLDFSALRVRPGRRELQVYFTHRSAWSPVTRVIDVEVRPPSGSRPRVIQAADARRAPK